MLDPSFISQSDHPAPNPFHFEYRIVDDLAPSTKRIVRKTLKLVSDHWITLPEELMLLRALDTLIKDLSCSSFTIQREAKLFIYRSSRFPFEYPFPLPLIAEALQLCPVTLKRELLRLNP